MVVGASSTEMASSTGEVATPEPSGIVQHGAKVQPTTTHACCASLQASAVHASPSSQERATPPPQRPPVQVCDTVQNRLVLHGEPSGKGEWTHAFAAAEQSSTVH